MKRLATIVLASIPTLLMTSAAYAQTTTVGNRLDEILKNITGPFIFLISLLCFVGGIWLLAKALVKLRESSGQGGQVGPAMAILLAAALLIMLPEAAGTGMLTLTGQQSGLINNEDIAAAKIGLDDQQPNSFNTPTASVAAVTDCYSSAEPVPCMAENVAKNVVPIGVTAVFVIVFIAGLWGLGHALFDLTKVEQGRGLPEGWWGRVIFNVVLLNASVIFQIVSQTILGNGTTVGGDGLNASSDLLNYDIGINGDFAQYEELIGYVFTILALFGAIAFVRGIFVCKAAGEGRQGGTYAHGIVFMVAGILLANSKASTCLVLNTMLGSSGTFGFCG